MYRVFFLNMFKKYLIPKRLELLNGEDIPQRSVSRYLWTKAEYNHVPNFKYMGTDDERQEYKYWFTYILDNLKKPYEELPHFQKHYVRVMQSNIPQCKQASGFITVRAFKSFELKENLTPENMRLANILGWCIDLYVGSAFIVDDMQDGSETRYGAPCWYKNGDVGLKAINDALLITTSTFQLLKKYYSNHKCYIPLMELFREISLQVAFVQALDMMAVKNGKPQFNLFTKSVYKYLVRNKGYPFLVMPITAAAHLCENPQRALYKNLENILLQLSEYMQVQNDISDCYGNPNITGKKGNDIQNARNTWLIVQALEDATPGQQTILKHHYGKTDEEDVTQIRAVYDAMHILERYLEYEDKTYHTLIADIQMNIPAESVQNYLKDLVDAVFVRDPHLQQ